MQKRIGVLTTSFPRFGGDFAGSFIDSLLRSMAGCKYRFFVLAPSYIRSKNLEVINGITVKRFGYFYPKSLQALTYNSGMPANLANPLSLAQIPLFMFFNLYHSFALALKSDILWSHWLIPSGFLGAILKKLTKKRHILTIHSEGGFRFLKRLPFMSHIAAFTLHNCDAITVVSENLKDKLLGLLPDNPGSTLRDKVRVCMLGVDLNVNRPRVTSALRDRYAIETKHVILFIGRLDKIKGLAYLIRAMQDVKDSTLIIAGEGKLKKSLMKLAQGASIQAKFVGLAGKEKKSDYFSLCDLVVVPSITLPCGRTEGLPVVILEAFAHARPVLASNVGGINEVIDDGYNGFLLEEKNPAAISRRINQILDNQDMLKSMQDNALSSSKKFDIQFIRKSFEEIIDREF